MARLPMSHQIRGLLAVAGIGLLAGCAYDPYTGTYVPCCAPRYAYAAPYPASLPAPGPAVAEAPAPGQYQYQGPPGQYQGPSAQYPGPSAQYQESPGQYPESSAGQYAYSESRPMAPPGAAKGQPHLAQRFARANVTGDGRLTLQQAQQANWRAVVRNFSAIDVSRKGYATLDDIRAWMAARRQGSMAQSG